jgi:coiled-coil domain-containing protein 12
MSNIMETNLAATSAARKERLIALRKRKEAVETGDGTNGSGP